MSIAACAALVERGDPDRFLSAMAAPVPARRVLFPLYAFNLEVARAPWVTAEPMIAEMRLQWWRDALAEIAGGGPVRRHEVATPLAEAIRPGDVPVLDALVAARRWDLGREGFADEAELAAHLDATAGGLMWVAARRLGAPEAAEPVVRDLAWGQGLAAWFQAVPALEAAGRRPLPDGRPGAVRALAGEGLRRIARARHSRTAIPGSAAPALLAAWLAKPLLKRAAADPGAVADGRLATSEFRRRAGLAFGAVTGRW